MSERRRLHPAAVGAEAVDVVRNVAVPLVAIVLVGGDLANLLIYGVLGGGLALVVSVMQWQVTRWWFDAGAVGLRRGVLTERVTTIPFDRVQAIDTVRGPVQRLFGVVALHVQAAGGGKQGEIVLKAVTPEDAEALREAVREGRGAPAEAEAAAGDVVRWRLERGPLVVAALTSASLGVLVPFVAGATQVLDDFAGAAHAERFLPDTAGEVALYALGVVAVAWLLSFLGTIVAFSGFTVTREAERLRIDRGFVERRQASVPVARVHAVQVIESPLRQPFGLAGVRIESAGYAAEAATAQTLIPLARRRDVPAILARLLPELADDLGALAPAPRRARRRYALGPVLVGALPAAVLLLGYGPAALPALALPLAGLALGLARHRAAGWRATPGRLVIRTRDLALRTAVADPTRLQEVGWRATPFQRRANLLTLAFAVGSGTRFRVRHLARDDVERVLPTLAAQARGQTP